MNARVLLVMAVVALLVSGPRAVWAQAAAAAKPAASAAKPKAAEQRPGVAAQSASGSGAVASPAPRTGSRAVSGAPAGATRASGMASPAQRTVSRAVSAAPAGAARARTLEDINIEGEITVPQVLFITARDQRRFVDFQHRRYLRTSIQVGETTRFPSWIAVVPGPKPEDNRKETSR